MEGLHLQEKLSVNTLHCKLQPSMEVILAGKVICEYIVTPAVHGLSRDGGVILAGKVIRVIH